MGAERGGDGRGGNSRGGEGGGGDGGGWKGGGGDGGGGEGELFLSNQAESTNYTRINKCIEMNTQVSSQSVEFIFIIPDGRKDFVTSYLLERVAIRRSKVVR